MKLAEALDGVSMSEKLCTLISKFTRLYGSKRWNALEEGLCDFIESEMVDEEEESSSDDSTVLEISTASTPHDYDQQEAQEEPTKKKPRR